MISELPQRQGKCYSGAAADRRVWMRALDKSGLPGKYKAWIYKHGVLPKSTVEAVEKMLNGYMRIWLHKSPKEPLNYRPLKLG